MLTAEKNRLFAATAKPVKKRIEAHVRWLEKELARTDGDLERAIEQSPAWRENEQLLRSVPGVGPALGRCWPEHTLLAELCPSSLGTLAPKELWPRSWASLPLSATPASCGASAPCGAVEIRGAGGVIHGCPSGHALQPCRKEVLRTAVSRRQA
jgi:hypothetical protein